uniref:Dynein heavy chain tail domain-containing protein n=1 Tax=Melopsittacus undulatus TaxID=13146 RepID=A0A8C6JJL6_MELUD
EALGSHLAGSMDISVLHATETLVIEWSQEIRDMLSKDSAEPLLEGLHPLPKAEFGFWHTRTVNLQCINDQLLSPRVTVLAEMLEKANSCFWPALQVMFQDVSAGKHCLLTPIEAAAVWLQPGSADPVTQPQPRSNGAPLPQLQPYLDRALCTVRLLRATCLHYSSPVRVVVILQEICNLLIHLVEPPPPPEPPPPALGQEWDGWHRAPVGTPTRDVYQTAIEFLKLEKAELGGVKGNILGTQVFQIYNEVAEIIKVFSDCEYDSLDPAEEVDFAEFQQRIEDIDRRLATIFCQGFEDCSCLMSAVKLVHMFSYLLERPVIRAELASHYSALLEMFKAELEDVKLLYDTQISSPLPRGTGPAINKNMPPVAGQLEWALELQKRLEGSYKDLFSIDHPYVVMVSAEAKLLSEKYKEMMELLQGFREEVYMEWVQGAEKDCHVSLEQPLILRDLKSSLLSVNFSKQVGTPWAVPAMPPLNISQWGSVQDLKGFPHKSFLWSSCLAAHGYAAGGEVPELPGDGYPEQREDPF